MTVEHSHPHFIDFHIHTNASLDCNSDPFHVVDAAIAHGLSAIAITDHNSVHAHQRLGSYAQERGLVLIQGVEVAVPEHLLFLGVPTKDMQTWLTEKQIPEGHFRLKRKRDFDLEETLRFVIDTGGITIVPHPTMPWSLKLPEISQYAEKGLVHGVEVNNADIARYWPIYKYWRWNIQPEITKLEITQTSNSDAHQVERVGMYANVFETSEPLTEVAILNGVKEGLIYPTSA